MCRAVISILIARQMRCTRKSKRTVDSYIAKHLVEEWCAAGEYPLYVSHGAFIVAAMIEGIFVDKVKGTPNARLSICSFIVNEMRAELDALKQLTALRQHRGGRNPEHACPGTAEGGTTKRGAGFTRLQKFIGKEEER